MTDRPPRRALALRLWAVAALVFGGVLVAPSAAQATPFPETWLADGNFHTYCFDASFTVANRPVGTNAMNVLGNTTDFTVSQDAACVAGSDVKWFQVNLPAGTRGQAQCMLFSGGRCQTSDVRMDFPEIDIGVNDAQDREKTAVHEVGHTVGLGHHSPASHDCAMVSGELPRLDIKWRRYRAAALYTTMLPFEEYCATALAVASTGPVALHLGRLADLLGDPAKARAHFDTAARISWRLGAPLWLAQARGEVSPTLIAGAGTGR